MSTRNSNDENTAARTAFGAKQVRPPHELDIVAVWKQGQQGIDGVQYQRSAQITLWSILQGAAFALLVQEIPNVITQAIEGKWYLFLYIGASVLIQINVWVQMAWAIIIARWQITVPHTTLIFSLGAMLSIACYMVITPWLWFLSMSFVCLLTIAIYTYNLRNILIENNINNQLTVKDVRDTYIFYVLACAMCSGLLRYGPDELQWVLGLFALVLSCLALRVQHLAMEAQRRNANIP